MVGKLEGRRILITGAASGIGYAIARLFAQEGSALVLVDRDNGNLTVVAAELRQLAFACDIIDRRELGDVVGRIEDIVGGLDGIVNAAGVLDITPFKLLSPEVWDRMIAVNLTGPYNVIHACLPLLEQCPSATVLNIASVSGLMPMDGTAAYSSSKAGVVMLGRCLGLELGPNIRVNTICPGVIQTGMTEYLFNNPDHVSRAADRVALKRTGEVADIAKTALFLTCDESSFITGASIPVDGGFSWR